MKKILVKLYALAIIFFSSAVIADQMNECSCCHMINNGVCALAPPIAPHVNIKFDFKQAELKTNLYAIEHCGTPFEIPREKPFIDGTTNEGDLLLVLCKNNELLDIKKLSISTNYSSSCEITTNIICSN